MVCSPRGCRTTTSIVRGSRRGDGNVAVRAAAGGSQREFGVETSHGEKKSGAAASGGARDDITSETSTKSFSLDLSAGTHSTGRNPISKQFKDPHAMLAPIRNEKGVISQSFWYL